MLSRRLHPFPAPSIAVLVVLLLRSGSAEAAASPMTASFLQPGSHQFEVPCGVTSVAVEVYGAQGGSGFASPFSPYPPGLAGGLGGKVSGSLSVAPGQTIAVDVGGKGGIGTGDPGTGGTGGSPGGGTGGDNSGGTGFSGGGGGGFSRIVSGMTTAIAGGGGGGGSSADVARLGGQGGGAGTNGVGITSGGDVLGGRSGGNGGAAGMTAGGPNDRTGGAGGTLQGGDGADAAMGIGGGGGGGGGAIGGGGGSSQSVDQGGSGGGGSGQAPGDWTQTNGVDAGNSGNGKVLITYTQGVCLPTVTITTPAEGATFLLNANVAADFTCTDTGGSGLASCTGDVADGAAIDTTTPGVHAFTVTAVSNNGATAMATNQYTVVAPNGGACGAPSDCVSDFCVTGVCCDTACSGPLERCNLPGQVGTCTAAVAPAPTLGVWGSGGAVLLLAGIAAMALRRRAAHR